MALTRDEEGGRANEEGVSTSMVLIASMACNISTASVCSKKNIKIASHTRKVGGGCQVCLKNACSGCSWANPGPELS